MERVIKDWVVDGSIGESSEAIRLADAYEWYQRWALDGSRPLCGIKKFGKILVGMGFVKELRPNGGAWIYIGRR